MNGLILMLGVLGVSFLILYFSRSIEKEHQAMKLFLSFIFVSLMLLVPSIANNAQENCFAVNNFTENTFIDELNFTSTSEYQILCQPSTMDSTNTAFFKVTTWMIRVFWLYTFFMLIYALFVRGSEELGKFRKW